MMDRGVEDVIIHGCGSLVGEFQCRGRELGRGRVCATLCGGIGVDKFSKTMGFRLPTACH